MRITADVSAIAPDLAPGTEAAYREIVRATGLLRRAMDPHFAKYGLSGAQWGVLRNLYAAEKAGEECLRLADLVQRLLVRPPSMTHVVERLRVAGLIVRETCGSDGRAKFVRLTDAGRERVEKVQGCHGKRITAVMGGLDAAEQHELRRLMDKLNSHLEQVVPAEPDDEETHADVD